MLKHATVKKASRELSKVSCHVALRALHVADSSSSVMSDEIITGMRLLGCNRVSDLKPELLEIMPGLLGQQPTAYSYKQDNQ